MTAPTLWYLNGLKKALDATLALGTTKVMFVSASYTLDQDAHDFINDVSTYEVTGTGVSAGGVSLGSPTTTVDGSTNTVKLSGSNISSINVSGCYAVVYVSTGTPSTSPVLAIVDLSEGTATNVTITGVTWNAGGIASITAA